MELSYSAEDRTIWNWKIKKHQTPSDAECKVYDDHDDDVDDYSVLLANMACWLVLSEGEHCSPWAGSIDHRPRRRVKPWPRPLWCSCWEHTSICRIIRWHCPRALTIIQTERGADYFQILIIVFFIFFVTWKKSVYILRNRGHTHQFTVHKLKRTLYV